MEEYNLCESVDDDHGILVDIFNILSRGNRLSIVALLFRVEVPRVELWPMTGQ